MAAASLPRARRRDPHGRGSRRRAYAVAGLLAACIVLVPAYVALVLSGNSDAARGVAGPRAAGASDRDARVTFHRSAGALGLRILRDAPTRTLAVRGRVLGMTCGHRAAAGLSLLQRRVAWPAGSATARVRVPRAVLASMEFCSLSDRGRVVARVVFR